MRDACARHRLGDVSPQSRNDVDSSIDGPWPRCVACGERIGVYEPAVWVIGSIARASSQAADPGLAAAYDRAFHADCYTAP
jgi:hypothetical protein